jgi:hypothetical protein
VEGPPGLDHCGGGAKSDQVFLLRCCHLAHAACQGALGQAVCLMGDTPPARG